MSHYEGENGTYKIPTSEWKAFKSTIVALWNEHQAKRLKDADYIFTRLQTAAKGHRSFDYERAYYAAASRRNSYGSEQSLDPDRSLYNILFPYNRTTQSHASKPRAPRRENFPTANLRGALPKMEFGDAVIELLPKSTVRWAVCYNNHAVTEAHEHPLGIAFFRALGRVTWTRGSGGFTVFRGESFSDSADFDGQTQVTNAFGPIGEREVKARSAARGTYFRASSSMRGVRGRTKVAK